jgi:hypothetical protein
MTGSTCVGSSPRNHISTRARPLARGGGSGGGSGSSGDVGGSRPYRWRGHVSDTAGVRLGHVNYNNQVSPWKCYFQQLTLGFDDVHIGSCLYAP